MVKTPQSTSINVKQTEAQRRDALMVRWTKVVGIFTALLFATSAIANVFIWLQWRVAANAQIDTREQLRAELSFQGISEITIPSTDGSGFNYAFVSVFNNVGGTRTFKNRGWTSIHYFPKSVPNSQDFSKPWDDIHPQNIPAGPNATIQTYPVTLPKADAEAVMRFEGIAVIWGREEYSDIFDKGQTTVIEFCYSLAPAIMSEQRLNLPNVPVMFRTVPFRDDCNKTSRIPDKS